MKILDNRDIDIINQVIQSQSWLDLTEKISFAKGKPIHSGKIEVKTPKGFLRLDMRISDDFPLGKIEFICTNHKGFDHEMPSGLLCLNAAPAASLIDRLELELEKLNNWIEKYFIREEHDEHFDYYQFKNVKNIRLLFEEDGDKPPLKGNCGRFNYGFLNQVTLTGKPDISTWIAIDLGGRKCRWSDDFRNKIGHKFQGIWIKLTKPPVKERRQTIENWEEIISIMDLFQTKFLYDHAKEIINRTGPEGMLFCAVGYEIPSGTGDELHWDLISIPVQRFPYAGRKIKDNFYVPYDLGYAVEWCRSDNVSHQRLFGRGALADSLVNGKILVIGNGAIGSSLFLTLVRGGCRNIEISDYDEIDPGNICRGQFAFTQSGKLKISELKNMALSISPFLNLTVSVGIYPITNTNPRYPDLIRKMQRFDYIFDCSTDKYLSIMIDGMNLPGQIVNFSITNKANQMAIITGKGNIHITKSHLFDKIAPGNAEPFFIATGCWHPTFQASFADINVLLMYGLNEINHRIQNGFPVSSFYISKGLNDRQSLIYEINYHV